jgi:hypothetical protein
VKPNKLPDRATLSSLFRYDDGALFWKERADISPPHQCLAWNRRNAGKAAGYVDAQGYITIRVNGVSMKAHRVIWALFNGADPVDQIDHINGTKTDNRISNLRQATHQQNQWNTKGRTKSGLPKGVHLRCDGKKFCAYIKRDGKVKNLGSFDTAEEASEAYASAARLAFGRFARAA